MLNNVSRSVARVLPRASIVSSRAAHTDKEFPNLEYYRMKEHRPKHTHSQSRSGGTLELLRPFKVFKTGLKREPMQLLPRPNFMKKKEIEFEMLKVLHI